MFLNNSLFSSAVRRKILSILDSIDFSQEIPEPLQLDFFDRAQIEQVIANCETRSAHGPIICNVKVNHFQKPCFIRSVERKFKTVIQPKLNTFKYYFISKEDS